MSVKSSFSSAVIISILGISLSIADQVDSTPSILSVWISDSSNDREEYHNFRSSAASALLSSVTVHPKQLAVNPSELTTEKYKKLLKKKKFRRRKLRSKLRRNRPMTGENDRKQSTTISHNQNLCNLNRGGCSQVCHWKIIKTCSCFKGFYLAEDNKTCLDIDECQIDNGGCEGICINTMGSYTCKCSKGFRLSEDRRTCEDVNECILRNGHGPCQDTCENTIGSYRCNCNRFNGTTLSSDGHNCEDLNECLIKNGGCSHFCINTFGSSFCSCPDGMNLASDWKSCHDINECEDSELSTSCPKSCLNTVGSYKCMEMLDLQNDQSIPPVCGKLALPRTGFFNCSRHGAHLRLNKKGRKRVVNYAGTRCELHCPTGYRLVGEYYVICASDGQWIGMTSGRCKRSKPPRIQCPPSQEFIIANEANTTLVKFHSPATNVPWKFVKSYPPWGKYLETNLTVGTYTIHFIGRDPRSKMVASCSFTLTVKPSETNYNR